MKFVISLLVSIAAIYMVGCNQSKTQTGEDKPNQPNQAKTVQPSQTPKPDANDQASWSESLDAVVAAPNNHKIVFENDRVRVLEVTIQPGEREPVHAHKWASVLYVMAEDNIRDYDIDDKVIYDTKTDKNPMKAPYTVWMEPQPPHSVENLSKESLRLLRVELKK
jgi:mannose-6-phosphate isomerase-like protein (cupin superfamily)